VDILAARKKAAERAQAEKQVAPALTQEPLRDPVPDVPEQSPANDQAEQPSVEAGPAPSVSEAPVSSVVPGTEKSKDDLHEAQLQEIEMLSFLVGKEAYAVFVDDVREVLKVRALTLVPNAPGYILGITSLRGMMLPVLDLGARLGLTLPERDEKARIIVVSPDEEAVGLMVDRVTGVIRILPDAIKPAPENVDQGTEFLRGIVRHNDRLYIVLDLVKAAG
jgi:purine-binding chemotaxis protein CheW